MARCASIHRARVPFLPPSRRLQAPRTRGNGRIAQFYAEKWEINAIYSRMLLSVGIEITSDDRRDLRPSVLILTNLTFFPLNRICSMMVQWYYVLFCESLNYFICSSNVNLANSHHIHDKYSKVKQKIIKEQLSSLNKEFNVQFSYYNINSYYKSTRSKLYSHTNILYLENYLKLQWMLERY